MFQIVGRTARREAARTERERTEARAAKSYRLTDASRPAGAYGSPWVRRAIAGELPASDRTGATR